METMGDTVNFSDLAERLTLEAIGKTGMFVVIIHLFR
jgi:hypothetical protein